MTTFWTSPEINWRKVSLAFCLQFISYVNLTVNFRAIAHTQYLAAGATASIAALLAYTIVRIAVGETKGHWALLGMMAGAFCADITGIFLTRHW
jgi:hypothetical protein